MNASEVQEAVLKSILQHNAETEYLRKYGLNGRLDPHSFKHCVPLVTHSDLQPYIQRIADGDKSSILTATPIEAISLSSGTSDGNQKYLPFTEEMRMATVEVGSIAAACRASVYPISSGARIMELFFCGKLFATKGRLTAGTATTHLLRNDAFKLRQNCMGVKACSPDEVVFGSDCRQTMYCHLLCGLIFSEEVETISAPFAYTLVEAFRTFELEWQDLCEDIRTGTLNNRITDPSTRIAVSNLLLPKPQLASVIARKCRQLQDADWHSAIPELWPRCKYVHSIMTGAMEQYVQRLQQYAGKVPLVSADYGATEAWIAVNVNPRSPPNNVSFTVVPSLAYFEFIPLYRPRYREVNAQVSTAAYEEGEPAGLTEVKVGQEYEIVLTTYGGLYRYRLGDVVRVTGFYNSSPQLAYVCRKNVVLSINIDKNTEKDLKLVVARAVSRLAEASGGALEVADYTSYADVRTTPGHYVIFWELGKSTPSVRNQKNFRSYSERSWEEDLLAECATLLDVSFVEPGYVTSRKMNTIGPLELCVVRRGTFARLLDRYVTRGAAITQYKTPRCIVSSDLLAILRSSTYASYFSSCTFR